MRYCCYYTSQPQNNRKVSCIKIFFPLGEGVSLRNLSRENRQLEWADVNL